MAVDDVDVRILGALLTDGRMSIAELAHRAHVSRTTAYSRLERLQVDGTIERFTVRLVPEALGLTVTALVLLSGGQLAWRTLRERITEIPEVQFAGFTTGTVDLVLLVRTRGMEELRELVLERLQQLPGIRGSQTLFIMDEVVSRTSVWPP